MRLLHYSDIENAHDDPDRIARLAGLLQTRRGTDSLVVGTGDNIAPGVLPLVTRGEQALAFWEAVTPDVSTFGNHDFDFGVDRVRELVARSPQTWISANIYDGEDRIADVDPWTVRAVDGTTVGLFGVTDPTTPSGNPSAQTLTITDPYAAAREAIDALQDRGVDHVVALSHLGRGDERLGGLDGIDAVLGGHVHSERIERLAGTVLARPGAGGDLLLELELPDGAVTRHPVAEGPIDDALAASYREQLAATDLDEVVARVADPIPRTEREAFRGESRVGNFVADAYRWAGERALDDQAGDRPPVVGLQNSGGIRSGPPLDGAVTTADLVSLVPFAEPLVLIELSGAELRDVFREGAETVGFGEADWWHAHVSGARLVYDYSDDRLVEARLADGRPIDPAARYGLATSEFLLYTETEFPTLTDADVWRTLDAQYEVLAAYARHHGIQPTVEGRIVRNGV